MWVPDLGLAPCRCALCLQPQALRFRPFRARIRAPQNKIFANRLAGRIGAAAAAVLQKGGLVSRLTKGEERRTQEAIRDAAIDVWIDWSILERRIEGTLPAIEGIRLIKEREES